MITHPWRRVTLMPEEKTQAAAAPGAVAAAIDGGSGAVWSELEMV